MILLSKTLSFMQHSFALILLSLRFDCSLSCLLHCSDTGIYSYEYLPEAYGGGREGLEIANKKWDCTDDTCMPSCGIYVGKYMS